jgi:hypothetical protein
MTLENGGGMKKVICFSLQNAMLPLVHTLNRRAIWSPKNANYY